MSPGRGVRRFVAAVVLACVAPAWAQLPPAQDRGECASIGVLVWTARALQARVEPELARQVLADMFAADFEPAERLAAYIAAAQRLASSPAVPDEMSAMHLGVFADQQCTRAEGDLSGIFGTSL